MNRTAIAILRLINAATRLTNPLDRRRYIREKIRPLSNEDKKALDTTLKTMILMTSGNVKTIRDPSLYDPNAGSWRSIASPSAMEVLNQIPNESGAFGSGGDSPTKEDYETAKRLMPILGSSFMEVDEIKALTGPQNSVEFVDDEHFYKLDSIRGFDTLYRGIKKLSIDTIKYAIDNPTWDIERGVSTSFNERMALGFAQAINSKHGAEPGMGPSILFVINNPMKKGFVSDELSEYGEQEVILSGVMDIEIWKVKAKGRVSTPGMTPFNVKANLYRTGGTRGTYTHQYCYIETMSGESMIVEIDNSQLDKLLDGKTILIDNKFQFISSKDKIKLRLAQSTILLEVEATLR